MASVCAHFGKSGRKQKKNDCQGLNSKAMRKTGIFVKGLHKGGQHNVTVLKIQQKQDVNQTN